MSEDVNKANEEAEAICKLLLDVKHDRIYKDLITADMVPVIKDAADNGNGLSAYVMGLLYDFGLKIDGKSVVATDADKKYEYLRAGAEAGDPFAQNEYAHQLEFGDERTEEHFDSADTESWFPWIVKAGENGNVFALHRMTSAYIDGSDGQRVDLKKALACFEKIVEAKDSEEWPDEMIVRAKGYLEFLPSIISGDAKAMRSLGEWLKSHEGDWDYTWGYGDADSESEFWLEKADGCK